MGWPEPDPPQRIIVMIHDDEEEESMSETETVIQPPAEGRRQTEYVLLRKDENEEAWRDVATVAAVNSNEALRRHANTGGDEGVYVAVPVRSWKRRVVSLENKPTVKIS